MSKQKTHWLQSPNKNYLGHWDLPNGDDFTLTIQSAAWEEVKNPITNKSEAKRVIRFMEKVKPLICNQTNAQAIIKATGVSFMEDAKGCRIKLYVGTHNDRRTKENVDCIRIRHNKQLNVSQIEAQLSDLFDSKKSKIDEKYKDNIKTVIDEKKTLSYHKTYNYLKAL